MSTIGLPGVGRPRATGSRPEKPGVAEAEDSPAGAQQPVTGPVGRRDQTHYLGGRRARGQRTEVTGVAEGVHRSRRPTRPSSRGRLAWGPCRPRAGPGRPRPGPYDRAPPAARTVPPEAEEPVAVPARCGRHGHHGRRQPCAPRGTRRNCRPRRTPKPSPRRLPTSTEQGLGRERRRRRSRRTGRESGSPGHAHDRPRPARNKASRRRTVMARARSKRE